MPRWDGFDSSASTRRNETVPYPAMPFAQCALCLQDRDLQDSHLMPRALYKYLRDTADANPNPLVVTATKEFQTSKQVSDYLLCAECEDRFNKGGEKWVIEACWQSETAFPLQQALQGATPLFTSGPDFTAYAGSDIPSIQIDKLAYFAASVLWRAGVNPWRGYGTAPTRLTLGPYQEDLRRYLVGSTAFPTHVVLIVTVASTLETRRNSLIVFPWRGDRGAYHKYAFVIPGVTFQLCVGNCIPAHVRACCAVGSPQNFLFISRAREEDVFQQMGHLLAKTV